MDQENVPDSIMTKKQEISLSTSLTKSSKSDNRLIKATLDKIKPSFSASQSRSSDVLNSEILNEINNNLTLVEKIKKFHLIDESFSIENGLLTPTMKVKRNKVIAKYKNILENFYKN